MATREIWHEIMINASPSDLYRAVTDVNKLAHWWTTDARGKSEVGENLEFWFSGYRGAVVEVSTLEADELVRWRVVDGGAKDWIGSEVEFKIFRDQGKTLLHFRHSKWHEDAKSFHIALWAGRFSC